MRNGLDSHDFGQEPVDCSAPDRSLVSHPNWHDAAVAEAVQRHGGFPDNWVPALRGTDYDVIIVGAGQSGLAIAFALRRAGIARTLVIDAAEEDRQGIWTTTARMNVLRSPKHLPGPELGIPELAFQAWYEARHGEKAYSSMPSISRTDWAEYLRWYRGKIGVDVRYRTKLTAILPHSAGLRLQISTNGQARELVCRKLVLATGFAGSGGLNHPAFIRRSVPSALYAHAEEPIDFSRLKGRRIAVFGAASAAFDAAAVALERGAASVHLFCRHQDLERHSMMRVLYYPGSVEHFRMLPDRDRWRIMSHLCRRAQGPVPETVRRAARFDAFHLHLGAREPVLTSDGRTVAVRLGSSDAPFEFDFIIAGTGYTVDLASRPELSELVHLIALWRDRYRPRPGEENDDLGRYPYLSAGFALTEKEPGSAPHLKNIHFFSAGAMVSNGRNPGEVSGLRFGVPQLVSAIGGDLFTADAEHHVERVLAPCDPILDRETYRHRVWNKGQSGPVQRPNGCGRLPAGAMSSTSQEEHE